MSRCARWALALGGTAVMASAVAAEPPRGRRSERPEPTNVVAAAVPCETVEGPVLVRAGTPVATLAAPRRGTVEVALRGEVEARCRVAAEALGLWVARDAAVVVAGVAAGDVYAGAWVRVVGRARAGQRLVESAGPAVVRFPLAADALSPQPHEFVFRAPPERRFVTPYADVPMYAQRSSVGTRTPAVATLRGGVEVVLIEQDGPFAKVRSHGPVEVEGWALNKQFADRGQEAEAALLKATHEVLVGTPLYASAEGDRVMARLRGGARVELAPGQGGRAKVTTTGQIVATGYVSSSALRQLREPNATMLRR